MTTPTDGESDAEWMSAAEAITFLGPNRDYGGVAICRHAKAGLVKARAKLLIGAGKRRSGDIPPDFWWAEGGEALVQDWTTGYFKTQPPGAAIPYSSVEAFSVEFRRSDILQLRTASAGATALLQCSIAKGGPIEVWRRVKRSRNAEFRRTGSPPITRGTRHVERRR